MSNKQIMTHIVAGYPSLKESEDMVMAMSEAGVSFIEIQIPFSDPVADGSTIMQASQAALENGVKVEDCFKMMRRLSKKIQTPLLFMTYYNILHNYGVEKFCKDAKEAGCYGFIVPDIPIDEEKQEHYLELCDKYGLNPIQVISPITPESRLKEVAKHARGCVYCVSRYGTTGAQEDLNPELASYLKKVRKHVDLPLAVGFGISKKSHVAAVCKHADIAVIGSAFIGKKPADVKSALEEFLG